MRIINFSPTFTYLVLLILQVVAVAVVALVDAAAAVWLQRATPCCSSDWVCVWFKPLPSFFPLDLFSPLINRDIAGKFPTTT